MNMKDDMPRLRIDPSVIEKIREEYEQFKEYTQKKEYMKYEERELERQCVQLARRHGWDAWKNENNGNKGIPDYSFLKGGRFVMVEFKRSAAARVRPEQLTWAARHPETVFFCHDIETFNEILKINKNE